MTTPAVPASDADDLDLDFTRKMRRRLVDDMTRDKIPDDLKERALLLQILDGMDRAALSKKKIKSDEGVSNTMALAAETISQLFTDPRLKKLGKSAEATGEIQVLRELPPSATVPGELDTVPSMQNYDTFMARHAPPDPDAA